MNKTEKVSLTKYNIEIAIRDYFRYTTQKTVQHNISKIFIDNLANSSVAAKEELRNLFRQSPHWNETLDALILDTQRIKEPNGVAISRLAHTILRPAMYNTHDFFKSSTILLAIRYFSDVNAIPDAKAIYLDALNEIAPKAYAPGKKKSRIFMALCSALGVADMSANSEFQKNFAKLADELNEKTTPIKLFVSLNPAHFLTMSNPKDDRRGDCLTSCHSLNDTKTDYNGGCTGYARDEVTMIAFTTNDPNTKETLNNRKITRQLFMYKPHNGVLLQSRMYNTHYNDEFEYDNNLYRSLIEQEIACCEHVPNDWKSMPYQDNKDIQLDRHYRFGGFPDWLCSTNKITLSINDSYKTTADNFIIGNAGLCIACGQPTRQENGLYCTDCKIKQIQRSIA